ncbi:MAG: hypothetical protein HY332_25830 [Chloroflexi bacterium]|nr:hypothetical protein [Chloroflexota bacterium]
MRVTVVGVCGAGKSELARRLAARGIEARTVAQEHSHVPDLWRHEVKPDFLVYLSASLRSVRRRGRSMSVSELTAQRRRLAGARRAAHTRVRTDGLTPTEVEQLVLRQLARRYAPPARRRSLLPPGETESGGEGMSSNDILAERKL